MNRFEQLLDEIVDQAVPLSSILLKARLLAADLPGRKFATWVQAELNGYTDTQPVPPYRVIEVSNRGNFLGAWRVTDAPLPINHLPPETIELLGNHRFTQGVGALEAFLRESKGGNLSCPWPERAVRAYRDHPGVEYGGCILTEAHQVLPSPAVDGILQAVRSRLLEFLLELRKRHPEITGVNNGVASLSLDEETALVEETIYNNCTFVENQSVAGKQINATGGINVAGDFVVADAIQSSFNRVKNSQASDGVKEKFKELSDAVKEMCRQLSADKANEAAGDLETLAKELPKPSPRKEWLKTAVASLVDLAKTVGNATVGAAAKAVVEHYMQPS